MVKAGDRWEKSWRGTKRHELDDGKLVAEVPNGEEIG